MDPRSGPTHRNGRRHLSGPAIEPAALDWRGDQPFSTRFGDIYHAADGAAEVRRVFLAPSSFETLLDPGLRPVIGELGFGSGLNFAVAAEACRAVGGSMHFVSFEAAPIEPKAFRELARRRSREQPVYAELAEGYPPLVRGWHRRVLMNGRITLSLFWGDAETGLADIVARQLQPVSAWFLDGFAPDRNPQMWRDSLFEHMARLSHQGSTVATFTAAGRVRRALEAVGFSMRRVDQRPHKRESLAGRFSPAGRPRRQVPARVRIAGAGLAGATVARHLAEQGVACEVWDPAPTRAPEGDGPGSQIPAAVLHGRLLADASTAGSVRAHAFLYASAFLSRWTGEDGAVRRTGVLQGAADDAGSERLATIAHAYNPRQDRDAWLSAVPAEEARRRSGWAVPGTSLWFRDGAVIRPAALCAALLAHHDVERRHERLTTAVSDLQEGIDVLACAGACRDFTAGHFLELAVVHGQLDVVQLEDTAPPVTPVVGNGYLVPNGGQLIAGATYEYSPWEPARATAHNLAQLEGHRWQWLTRARGTRCVSSDRLPVAGPLYARDGSELRHCLVSTGHGSMGMASAPLAAAILTARVLGDFAPLTTEEEVALSPQRFRERQARRGYRFGARN
ncbi:MAG: tRNA (5-methylaminomethyl-2-thiouridine)(34)-methyltransferase MnmD [Pseudomonadales bacterium]